MHSQSAEMVSHCLVIPVGCESSRSRALLASAAVAEAHVAGGVCRRLQELKTGGARHAAHQRAAAAEERGADDELVLVDQPVLRELRHDGPAAEDHDVLAGL